MYVLKDATKRTFARDAKTEQTVRGILENVRKNGDAELRALSLQFDHLELPYLRVPPEEIRAAYDKVAPETVEALRKAAEQITFYAEQQLACLKPLDVASPIPGVRLGHRLLPVEAAGAYVPGGRYPLPSTALMLAIPARVAGVKRIAACSPPSRQYGTIHPAVLVAMDIAGVTEAYCVGGAQAVAALAYGTETIPAVDLIVGPGNRFVTEAKRQVLGDVGIDSLAGPSEVLILADETAQPDFVAIDLLAQSEHDPNVRATLVTPSEALGRAVLERLPLLAQTLSTGEAALKSWEDNGLVLIPETMDACIATANDMAPEHLEVQVDPAKEDEIAAQLHNFGSLFIGSYAPVAFGDYCSGTNHTLPTMRTARYANGVWPGTFLKTSFVQHISEEGCRNMAATCIHLAGVEGLMAHQRSVSLRVEEK